MSEAQGMQKQLYGIGIFEEEIVLSDFTDGGERRFVVTPEQLMTFVSTEVTFRPFPGLIWMKRDQQCETHLFRMPAGKRTILYRKGKKLTDLKLELPPMIVQVRVNQSGSAVQSINMWCFSGRALHDDTVLYQLPLPNLTGSSLCLGGGERTIGKDVRTSAEKAIFDTPFNHHNHLVGREKIPFHDYAKKYKGTCPLRTLKQIETGRKVLKGLI